MQFRQWKIVSYFIEVYFFGYDSCEVFGGFDIGLEPVRYEAITWNNDDPVQRRIFAAFWRWVDVLLMKLFFLKYVNVFCHAL